MHSALLAARTESSICEWAIEQLQRSNQKGQQTIVREGLAGSGIIPSEHVNPLAKLLNDIRVDIAHKGIVREIYDDSIAIRFYYLADLLEWLVRHEILIRLGVPREQMSARITGNARFRELLTQLGISNTSDS